MVATVGITLF